MKFIYVSLPIVALLGLQMARAGFRHPVEQTGEQAAAVQSTEAQRMVAASGKTSAVGKASITAAPTKARALAEPVPPALTYPGQPADRRAASTPPAQPVPKAGALPETATTNVGKVNLPQGRGVTVFRDALPAIEFKGYDRAQRLHAYSRQARMLPLPLKEHEAQVRSRAIAEKYKAALSPVVHQRIHTPLQLQIDSLAKITLPARPLAFRQTVKRIDALFEGLDKHYARGIVALWELSRSRLNPPHLRARDSLFSGILTHRAGWEAVAANQFEAAANQYLQDQERYVQILWQQLQNFENPSNVDRVVNHFDLTALEQLRPVGDKANFSLAKKALRESQPATAEEFAGLIRDQALAARYSLLQAISTLQPREKAAEKTRHTLESLAANGHASVRNEARLALARALLRQGATQEALDFYRAIQKDGKNRLEVMSEQSYAEFLNGNHPEALGKAIGAESKFFQYGFSPDVHLVETISRKANCDFGGAEAALQRFAERYQPELAELEGIVKDKKDPLAYYEELIAYHGLESPRRYQRFLLRLPVVAENQKLLNQAEKNLHEIELLGIEQRYKDRPENWGTFALAMRNHWDKRVPKLKQKSGESALAEATYMATRLRQNFDQAELMGLDLSTSAAKDFNMQNALNFPVRKIASTEPNRDQTLWPFEQEIWEDELDSLRMKNPSKCALAKPAP